MFDDKKLIELCEFHFDELKAAQIEDLCDFLASAGDCDYAAVLINVPDGALDYGIAKSGKISRPSALFKKLNALTKYAYFPRQSQKDLAVWAGRHFSKDKIQASFDALYDLIAKVGTDMMTLSGEIEKLCIYMKSKEINELTPEITDLICCKNTDVEPFALSNALLSGKTDTAISILFRMEQQHIRPAVAFAGIYGTYIDLYRIRACLDGGMTVPDIAKKLKMNEYRTKIYADAARNSTLDKISAILSLCRDEDLKIKSEYTDYNRIEMLICRAARL